MAIPKVMGIETEYGITVPDQSEFNPVLASSMLINSYVASELRRIRWDYEEETPLRDARGFETVAAMEPPSDEELGLANVILTNGARYYVDHAHPEYSTPECSNPRDLVIHDKAGERILERSAQRATETMQMGRRVLVYKNNTDGKGASYGTHENYLVSRETPFPRIVHDIIPYFVSRQIFLGAGLLGGHLEQQEDDHRFQVSQRADFFEVEVGLETTLKRPLVNTRDEPHADPDKYRRLHVIIGDANMSEVAIYLKTGITAIVLMMIEDEAVTDDWSLENPVQALRRISHDLTCSRTVKTKDGRDVRAVDIQWGYHEMARKYLMQHDAPAWAADVMSRWEETLAAIERDPMELEATVDWVAKFKTLEGYRTKHGLDWSDPRLSMVDLQYHDVRQDRGIANVLARKGKLERLVSDEEILRAIEEPPGDTRAFFRGRCLAKYPDQVAAASWDSVIFDTGGDTMQRVPMQEPLRGTESMVADVIEASPTALDLLRALQG